MTIHLFVLLFCSTKDRYFSPLSSRAVGRSENQKGGGTVSSSGGHNLSPDWKRVNVWAKIWEGWGAHRPPAPQFHQPWVKAVRSNCWLLNPYLILKRCWLFLSILMSGSCHLDRASNDKFSVECLFWLFQRTWKADLKVVQITKNYLFWVNAPL